MPDLRIGTCSWKYDSWKGIVYSGQAGGDALSEYSRLFNTVEIDQWFWSLHGAGKNTLPDPAAVRSYAEAVPGGFRFTVKAPNSLTLTHFYRKSKTDPLVPNPNFLSVPLLGEFLERLDPMKSRLGPILFQFEYLNRQKIPSQSAFLDAFGAFIRRCPDGYAYGLEIRNPNYLNESLFAFMEKEQIVPVLLEGYYMPPVVETAAAHMDRMAGTVVLRLHGPDREGMEEKTGKKWDRIVAPKDAGLKAIAGCVEGFLGRGVSVYVNVNNHYEGCAPLTIEKLRRLLKI
ncbi:MAG: DUF72 domain-containing protein [bacterium]|nr:DUF72 domain-containing protein [bacterium]